jgi:hypothetical protein
MELQLESIGQHELKQLPGLIGCENPIAFRLGSDVVEVVVDPAWPTRDLIDPHVVSGPDEGGNTHGRYADPVAG